MHGSRTSASNTGLDVPGDVLSTASMALVNGSGDGGGEDCERFVAPGEVGSDGTDDREPGAVETLRDDRGAPEGATAAGEEKECFAIGATPAALSSACLGHSWMSERLSKVYSARRWHSAWAQRA